MLCSYDSDEERYRARHQAAHRGAALRAEQNAQAHLLQAYRARQQQRQQLEQAMLMAKLREQQGIAGGEWVDGDTSSKGWQGEHGWRDGGSSSASAGVLRVLQQHESRWEALQLQAAALIEASRNHRGSNSTCASSRGGLTVADVPWPPMQCSEYLHGLAALDQQQQQHINLEQQLQHRRAARSAYARACRRWHPDKFVARWGMLLAAADRSAILLRVQQLSQGINEAWEAQQREWEGDKQG